MLAHNSLLHIFETVSVQKVRILVAKVPTHPKIYYLAVLPKHKIFCYFTTWTRRSQCLISFCLLFGCVCLHIVFDRNLAAATCFLWYPLVSLRNAYVRDIIVCIWSQSYVVIRNSSCRNFEQERQIKFNLNFVYIWYSKSSFKFSVRKFQVMTYIIST